jgi:hypothetical protein
VASVLDRIFGPQNIPNGSSVLFTGTPGTIYTIRDITVVNGTAGSITVRLGINGVANVNLFLPPVALGAGEFCVFAGVLTLTGADTMEATTTATGLTITVSGVTQT